MESANPQPIPGFVQIINNRPDGGPPAWASRLVWWLAKLALINRRTPPFMDAQVGDIVIETSHCTVGDENSIKKLGVGFVESVGELIKIEHVGPTPFDTVYTIRTLEGKEVSWSHAFLAVIERPEPKKPE